MKPALTVTPLDEALELFFNTGLMTPKQVRLATTEAWSHVLAEPVMAVADSPSYDSCAMDGIAVIAAHCTTASPERPLHLTDYVRVNTGHPLVSPYDSVVMIEAVQLSDDGVATLTSTVTKGQHVRHRGEDMVAGHPILPQNHRLSAIDLGALLSGGVAAVTVYAKPQVAVIATGSELIDVTQFDPAILGQVVESNSYMLEALLHEHHVSSQRYAKVDDDLDSLTATLQEAAASSDLIILSAGTSAGTHDYTAQAIQAIGEVVVHGLALRPGKPAILGYIGTTPVVGLPGYPVSAYVVFQALVVPLLHRLYPADEPQPMVQAKLAKRIVSSFKQQEYLRVSLSQDETQQWIATPLPKQVGSTLSLVTSHGFLVIPRLCEGIEAGETVPIHLHRPH